MKTYKEDIAVPDWDSNPGPPPDQADRVNALTILAIATRSIGQIRRKNKSIIHRNYYLIAHNRC